MTSQWSQAGRSARSHWTRGVRTDGQLLEAAVGEFVGGRGRGVGGARVRAGGGRRVGARAAAAQQRGVGRGREGGRRACDRGALARRRGRGAVSQQERVGMVDQVVFSRRAASRFRRLRVRVARAELARGGGGVRGCGRGRARVGARRVVAHERARVGRGCRAGLRSGRGARDRGQLSGAHEPGHLGGAARIVNEVATGPVGTEARRVEGAAELSLVLGVPSQGPQLDDSVRELALLAVLASAILLEGATEFRFITGRILLLLLLAAQRGRRASGSRASLALVAGGGAGSLVG